MVERLAGTQNLATAELNSLVRCTEVEVDLGPSHMATVYYRAISGAETGLGCVAFPTAAFGTVVDLRRCYYSGFPWRRDHRNTAIQTDMYSKERSVDPVPMANSGLRSVGTGRDLIGRKPLHFVAMTRASEFAIAR